jgi:SulP family sulfate permease
VSLVDVSAFREYWHHSRPQFLVALPTFVATLALAPHIERGLLIGVGLALAVHLWRETRLDVDAWRVERTLYVLPHGVLYFGSAPAFQAAIGGLLAENPDADVVEIDLHRLGRVDLTGIYALRDIVDSAREGGTTVHFTRIPPHAAERVEAVLGPRPAAGESTSPVDTQ